MGALKYYDTATSSWKYVDQPGGANSWVFKENISGANGVLTAFATVRGYVPGSLQVFVNGVAQAASHITETTPASGLFSLDVAPATGANIMATYQANVPPSGNSDTLDGEHLTAILQAIYPVGATFISGSSTMPALISGIGTWARLNGRFIVGVDETQTEFDTVGETGGAKTHTLTNAEMPTHSLTMSHHGDEGGSPIRQFNGTGGTTGGTWLGNTYRPNGGSTGGAGSYQSPSITWGSDTPHNNLPPYKTKYMWERTA